MSSSPAVRRAPEPRERVPAVAGQRAGAEQDRAGEPVGLAGCPARPQGPPKSWATRWTRSIPSASSARPMNCRVCRDGLGEPGRRGGVPNRGRPRPQRASGGRGGEQRFPVRARARVAVQEDDGLGASGGPASRSGVRISPTRSSRRRTPSTCSFQATGAGRAATRAAIAGRSTWGGRSRMPITAMRAPATAGSCSAVARRRRR